uniref:SH3 domain-containing protein n=1 Tax=Haplochromis burtoni TaxID=8153 RepID=A0A3Q3C9L1_HAPBU
MNYGWILLIFYLYVVTKQIYRFGISYRLLHLRWLFCPAHDGAPGAPSSGLAVLLKSRRTCFWLRPVKIMNVFHSVSLLGLDTNWASEDDNHVVARGEYDFTAASQEELSMRAGEMLNLAPKGDELFTSCGTFDSDLGFPSFVSRLPRLCLYVTLHK